MEAREFSDTVSWVLNYTLNLYLYKKFDMKKFVAIILVSFAIVSCSSRSGCPTNGRNVGAERILAGEKKAIDAARKAPKFKS